MNTGTKTRSLWIAIATSFIVAILLVIVGIFILSGIQNPGEGLSYGFVVGMLKEAWFLEYHMRAAIWLFCAGLLSSLATLYLVMKRKT